MKFSETACWTVVETSSKSSTLQGGGVGAVVVEHDAASLSSARRQASRTDVSIESEENVPLSRSSSLQTSEQSLGFLRRGKK